MREITAYAANDGTRFFDRDACLLHDAELAIVALAMSGLNLPDNLPHGTFDRVDPEGRFWQQHYFLLHPGEGRGEWGGKGRP